MNIGTTSGGLTEAECGLAVLESPAAVASRSATSRASVVLARLADCFELTKPKIAALELVTVAAAAFIAGPRAGLLLHVLLGTALVAASASAANQWLERRRDRMMERTASRPLPAGRLSSVSVVTLSAVTFFAGMLYLAMLVNLQTAAIGLLSWILYVLVYTPLKSRTPANTWVGAVAGALPALMGWTAMGRPLDMVAASLFLVLFLWQLPHFMAIAWLYREQYRKAGMRMITVVDPSGLRAGAQAVLAALVLIPVSLVPVVQPQATNVRLYFLWAMLLGAGLLATSVAFLIRRNQKTARLLLRVSIVYLPALLLLLMLAAPSGV